MIVPRVSHLVERLVKFCVSGSHDLKARDFYLLIFLLLKFFSR